MRVLMTGTSGRVGSVIAQIIASQHNLIGVDIQPGPWTTLIADFASSEFLNGGYLHGVDALVHTAALHAPHVLSETEADFRRINVHGTKLLLDAACLAGVRRIVYSSSTSVYGHSLEPADDCAVWVSETLQTKSRDIYDETKLAAEALVHCAAATTRNPEHPIPTAIASDKGNASQFIPKHTPTCVILRFGRCFPEDIHKVAIYRCHRGVDARDVGNAHLLALTASLPSTCETFNIAARTPFHFSDCHTLYSDAPSVIRRRMPALESWLGVRGHTLPDSIDRVYVIERAEHLLGYRPIWNIEEFLNEHPIKEELGL